jgi:hypothetical protein
MGVIRHEYPCIALGFGFRQENRKPFNKVFTIFIIIEYPSALYSPYHDMMQEAGTIESGYPGHDYKLLLQLHAVKLFDYLVAVGMPVTRHPPHRSGLEELPHPAPTSGINAQTLLCRDWLPPTDCLPYLLSSLYKSESECR